ncbi:4-hydroxy-3-methylbut-2-enyl diphosphate reductase [bacterium]|nr:4-hydroxy-3-methylbut-2-enyl diphosphate reductase [bacterium]
MKQFDIPTYYRSSFIGSIKEARKISDPRKKDFTPTLLDFGPVQFYIARHFGFCYGVENAIEIAYKAVEENPGKRILLLSQMIHNPIVNADLQSKGIDFIMDTEGNHFIEWDDLKSDDIVIIPAFGTTLEIEQLLKDKNIETQKYNTTCPFVNKVWKQSDKLGQDNYTVLIHGKHKHEETRATFSHSNASAPSIIIKDIVEARIIGDIILGKREASVFFERFEGMYSADFDIEKHLERVGVVNQTTMLASETQEIADYFKQVMLEKYGADNLKNHFADTRDTLCYATNDNQQATYGLLEADADLAIVVGGYNSSNTSHIVELCEAKLPTYFISSADEILDESHIQHFNYHHQELRNTENFLPKNNPTKVILTSGASCPDTMIDAVISKILTYFPESKSMESVLKEMLK